MSEQMHNEPDASTAIEDLFDYEVDFALNGFNKEDLKNEFEIAVELGVVGEKWRRELDELLVKWDKDKIQEFRKSKYLHLK